MGEMSTYGEDGRGKIGIEVIGHQQKALCGLESRYQIGNPGLP